MKKISIWQRLLDLIAPRLCVVCGRRLSPAERVLCAVSNLHLPRTGFQQSPADNRMARLFWGVIPVEHAAALFYYEASSPTSNILYDLKYHDHPEIGREMGRLMARELTASDFFEGIDVIIPLPLAKKRRRQRGYNQSMELARGVSEVTGLPVWNQIVRRTRFVKSQTQMGRQERMENVADVFEAKDLSAIRGRHVLLVDDVVTTGATMMACAREILKTEGVRVSLLALGFTKS